ncbi:hypothetical protein [Nannocystis punicea]|uniref:Uncharacterized protein n=1 Tax=Nannocystis punicea TaxID=2995304 RepID=A0ABY7GUL0_9BACT|nr:hypothetical protein [Nannocystis poenicansa]WAS90643.1 hypothetical protein O0S08_31025 [Nannocystis poenicansa]
MKEIWYSGGAPFGGDGTYGEYPLAKLPRIAVPLRGTFAWLPPSADGGLAYADRREYEPVATTEGLSPEQALLQAIFGPPPEPAPPRPGWEPLTQLAVDASAVGLAVPPEMIAFLSRPELFERVPTCTACYLELSRRLLPAPVRDRRLIRFLNDQQCSVLWYVMLAPDGGHSIVAAYPRWKNRRREVTAELDDEITPTGFVRCASSFEEFIYRFWIENSIWYAEHRNPSRPPTPEQAAYAEHARGTLVG